MPAKPAARAPQSAPALYYTGDASGAPHISGIPSVDLSSTEVTRLASAHGLTVTAFVALATGGPFTLSAPPAADEPPSADGEE